MIVLIDERAGVGAAYVASLERDGICGMQFDWPSFQEWFGGLSSVEAMAIQAFVVGDGDWRIPGVRDIKRRSAAPLIALADRKILSDTLQLFDAGFDEVLGKPVHSREILARIQVISRRTSSGTDVAEASQLIVYADGRDPVVCGETLVLPRRERRILECLVQSRTAWITKSQIFSKVYGLFNEGYDESVIESHICRLRRRLRVKLGYDPIESQRYLGYRVSLRAKAPACGSPAASLAQTVRANMATKRELAERV